MSLRVIRRLLLLAAIGGFVYWIATHTYWADEMVPQSMRGEALRDPFYAAERLSRALGAHASFDRLWGLPAQNAVVVKAFWNWDRSRTHRAQLQYWVESGGRLVTDLSYLGDSDTFSRWSGISRRNVTRKADQHSMRRNPNGCRVEQESGPGPASGVPRLYELCGLWFESFLASTRAPLWQVGDASGVQALRIPIGQGSVTVMNGEFFTYNQLLKGSHAALFVAATQLHSGDDIHFFSDMDQPSLLGLTWRFGAPVVVLLLVTLALALWRAAPRFGPTMASPESARRSLGDQIRGTGQFLLRVGDGQALHAATVRALQAAATRRITAFARLSGMERINSLAHATGLPADALAAAVNYAGTRRSSELHNAIALLEAARREILRNDNRSTHGN